MDGKIYAITAGVQGAGAKYAAFYLAVEARKQTKDGYGDVLLIDFDFDQPYAAYRHVKDDKGHGFDSLLGMISPVEELHVDTLLSQVTETTVGIDVLRGTRQPGQTNHIDSLHIEKILRAAREAYDVTIVVIRQLPTCPGAVQALIECDRAVIVTEDNYTNADLMPRTIRRIRQYYGSSEPVGILYNRYQQTTDGGVAESIGTTQTLVEAIGFIQYDPQTVDHKETAQKKKKKKTLNDQAWSEAYQKMIRRYA